MFEAEQKEIARQIEACCAELGLPKPTVQWTWIPFSGQWGISTSFFQLAAEEMRQTGKKVAVPLRAQELAQAVASCLGTPSGFARLEAVRGYLNLFFSTAEYARRVIDTVLEQKETYGRAERRHQRVMVEFSQPNTHKAFHVGHLRSAILGDVLCRMLDAAGYDVVRVNYPGDIGMHVVRWLWNYMKFHRGERPEKDITQWMGKLYAEATRRLEENPELDAEVRAVYTRWDQRDPEVVSLWEETRQWSLDGFNVLYDQLGIHFDRYYFQSMVEQAGKQVVEELIARGIAQDERPTDPVIVKIDELLGSKDEKYRVMVALRSDSTALYATEDLALAIRKFNDYPDLVKSFYVVDVRQSLHFQQVFKTLEIAGFPWANRCQHVPYELVNLPGNVVMASREGTVVLLEDLIREATNRALEIVEQKSPELDAAQKQAIAQAVGIGAIKYPMLSRENTKRVTFDWQAAMKINGQASPYIQYAYVRTGSILRKAGFPETKSLQPGYELSPEEVELINTISRIPDEILQAAKDLGPLNLANLVFDLARVFNDFYDKCPVLKAKKPVRQLRLRLVEATRYAIGNVLGILGITAPQAM